MISTTNPPESFDHDLAGFVRRNDADFLYYANPHIEYVQQLSNLRGFHIIRDPRDILVSAYYSHLYTHPENWRGLAEHRRKLRSLSKDDGLFLDLQFSQDVILRMADWDFSDPNILEMTMEAVIENPYKQFLNVFWFLGILDDQKLTLRKRVAHTVFRGLRRIEQMFGRHISVPIVPKRLPAERLLGIIWENDFATKAGGRQRGEEDPRSHYRKGVSGDWRIHFTNAHVEQIKKRFNDVLLKLGYEHSPDWQL